MTNFNEKEKEKFNETLQELSKKNGLIQDEGIKSPSMSAYVFDKNKIITEEINNKSENVIKENIEK
jgi:hypothetical protein